MDAEDAVQGLGGIVLAAGPSRRLGTPRQLLELRGEALVRRAARAAVEAGLWPVVVVVGDCAEEVRAALAGLPLGTGQPAVRAAHLRALAAARQPGGLLAASSYSGSVGMPVLVPAALFSELRALTGEACCAELLMRHAARVAPVPLPDGELDVDTPEDWARAQRLER